MTWFLLCVIVVVAIVLFFVPNIDPTLKKLLIGVCVILFVLWVLMLLFGFGGGPGYLRQEPYYHTDAPRLP